MTQPMRLTRLRAVAVAVLCTATCILWSAASRAELRAAVMVPASEAPRRPAPPGDHEDARSTAVLMPHDAMAEPLERSERMEGFPFEEQGDSAMAGFEGSTSEGMTRLRQQLDGLRKALERAGGRDRSDRAGLPQHTPAAHTHGRDSLLCAVPGLADAVQVAGLDWCLHGTGRGRGVAARPLMRMGAPSKAEEAQERQEAEEERLKRASEAVDAAEDKMGDFWTPPNGFPGHGFLTGTQAKDVILPAQEGTAQRNAWDKLRRLFSWLPGDVGGLNVSLPDWHWHLRLHCARDEGWHWLEGSTPGAKARGFRDPTCGSDLTLHSVEPPQTGQHGLSYGPFAGAPLTNKPLPVGSVAPYLKDWGKIVKTHKRRRSARRFRSPFAGAPIRNGPLPVGDVDPWLLPHTKPRPAKGKPWVWRWPLAGTPITGGVSRGGAIAPMPAPQSKPKEHKPRRWVSPFAGVPITHDSSRDKVRFSAPLFCHLVSVCCVWSPKTVCVFVTSDL